MNLPHYQQTQPTDRAEDDVPFTLRLALAEIHQELDNLTIPLETVGTLS